MYFILREHHQGMSNLVIWKIALLMFILLNEICVEIILLMIMMKVNFCVFKKLHYGMTWGSQTIRITQGSCRGRVIKCPNSKEANDRIDRTRESQGGPVPIGDKGDSVQDVSKQNNHWIDNLFITKHKHKTSKQKTHKTTLKYCKWVKLK